MFEHPYGITLAGTAWRVVLLLCTPPFLAAQQLDGVRPAPWYA
jgi:hypothetical protein